MGAILVLEDDPAVQGVVRAVLVGKGYVVEIAGTVGEALTAFNRGRGVYDLLIADVRLPSGSGTDVAVALSHSDPGLPILFTSGTDIEFWSEADRGNVAKLPKGSFAFLPKPFTCWTLMDKVAGLLQPFTLPQTA